MINGRRRPRLLHCQTGYTDSHAVLGCEVLDTLQRLATQVANVTLAVERFITDFNKFNVVTIDGFVTFITSRGTEGCITIRVE